MKNNGFTLIELLIVIAIIGILAAIAYPSYQGALRDSRRAVAEGDLLELSGDMERYYTTNSTYNGASLAFNESPQEGITKFYDLTLAVNLSGAAFTVTAAPKGAQSGDYCGTLSMDNTGTTSAAVAGCW